MTAECQLDRQSSIAFPQKNFLYMAGDYRTHESILMIASRLVLPNTVNLATVRSSKWRFLRKAGSARESTAWSSRAMLSDTHAAAA
jgi:hypothetical protein